MARNLDFWALPALTLDLVDQGRNPAKRRLTVTGRVDNDQESGSPLVHAAFDPQNDDDDDGDGDGDDCEMMRMMMMMMPHFPNPQPHATNLHERPLPAQTLPKSSKHRSGPRPFESLGFERSSCPKVSNSTPTPITSPDATP